MWKVYSFTYPALWTSSVQREIAVKSFTGKWNLATELSMKKGNVFLKKNIKEKWNQDLKPSTTFRKEKGIQPLLEINWDID